MVLVLGLWLRAAPASPRSRPRGRTPADGAGPPASQSRGRGSLQEVHATTTLFLFTILSLHAMAATLRRGERGTFGAARSMLRRARAMLEYRQHTWGLQPATAGCVPDVLGL